MPILTLLTDFALQDTFVGQVKGAILSIAPATVLADLTHAVPRQDIRSGAFLLWSAVEAFPAGTVHLAVVDPGVGSSRRAVAVRSTRGDLFVGPDNGLLVPALERVGGQAEAVELTDSTRWRTPTSSTFHARDIFGPVAAHLALGVPLASVGTAVEDLRRPIQFPAPQPSGEGGVSGEVLYVDIYGNLVTNIPGASLPKRFTVRCAGEVIAPHPHYQAVRPGALLAVVGGDGLLEICARDADAAESLGAHVGDAVIVEPA